MKTLLSYTEPINISIARIIGGKISGAEKSNFSANPFSGFGRKCSGDIFKIVAAIAVTEFTYGSFIDPYLKIDIIC